MKLTVIAILLLGSQVFANTNIKIVSTNKIQILAGSPSTEVLAHFVATDSGFGVNLECHLVHDILPYNREIGMGSTFFVKSMDVNHSRLSESDHIAILKSRLLSLGWNPESIENGILVTKELPKTVNELTQLIEDLGGRFEGKFFDYKSTIELIFNDSTERSIELSCYSSKHLSIYDFIDILNLVGPDSIYNSLKIDNSF